MPKIVLRLVIKVFYYNNIQAGGRISDGKSEKIPDNCFNPESLKAKRRKSGAALFEVAPLSR